MRSNAKLVEIEATYNDYESAESWIIAAAHKGAPVAREEILRILLDGDFIRRRVSDLIIAAVLDVPLKKIDEKLFKSPELFREIVICLLLLGNGLSLPEGICAALARMLGSVDDGPLDRLLKRSPHRPVLRFEESYGLEAAAWVELAIALKEKESCIVDFIATTWGVSTDTIRAWRKKARRSHGAALKQTIDLKPVSLTAERIREAVVARGADRHRLISAGFHV